MGVNVTGYTEAKIDGKWYCIDFFQYDMEGRIRHIPCIEGRSMVYSALQLECSIDEISAPTDLSEQVCALCTRRDGKLLDSNDPHWTPWRLITGRWLASVDLNQPEFCGFFKRQAVADYLSNPEENSINEDEMLGPEGYRALSDEEKKAYQYFEYTPTWGNRAILRRFKQAVQNRVSTWNSEISWRGKNKEISLSDVRVLLTVS